MESPGPCAKRVFREGLGGVADSCLKEHRLDWQTPHPAQPQLHSRAAAHLGLVPHSLRHPGQYSGQNWHSAALEGWNIRSWVLKPGTLEVVPCGSLVLSPRAATSSYMTLSIIFPIWALILASLQCAVAQQRSPHLSYQGMGQEGGCGSG